MALIMVIMLRAIMTRGRVRGALDRVQLRKRLWPVAMWRPSSLDAPLLALLSLCSRSRAADSYRDYCCGCAYARARLRASRAPLHLGSERPRIIDLELTYFGGTIDCFHLNARSFIIALCQTVAAAPQLRARSCLYLYTYRERMHG